MAKSHKHADDAIAVTSTLPPDRLAELCKQAADQSRGSIRRGAHQIRLEHADPGCLVFSVRDRQIGGRMEYLSFEVTLAQHDGQQRMTSRIKTYKTQQPTMAGFIPAGPKSLVGLHTYREFMQRFGDLVKDADPAATATVTGGA